MRRFLLVFAVVLATALGSLGGIAVATHVAHERAVAPVVHVPTRVVQVNVQSEK